jgi:hypothetical protein
MKELNFTYQKTKEDIMAFSIWHRMVKNKFFFVLNFLFPVVGVAALIQAFTTDIEVSELMYFAMFYLVLYPGLIYFFIKIRVNSVLKDPSVNFDVTTFTVNKFGINIESDKGVFLLVWDNVYQVFSIKGFIYVYVDKNNPLIFNKVFLGEDNTQLFLEIIKEHAPKVAIKFK